MGTETVQSPPLVPDLDEIALNVYRLPASESLSVLREHMGRVHFSENHLKRLEAILKEMRRRKYSARVYGSSLLGIVFHAGQTHMLSTSELDVLLEKLFQMIENAEVAKTKTVLRRMDLFLREKFFYSSSFHKYELLKGSISFIERDMPNKDILEEKPIVAPLPDPEDTEGSLDDWGNDDWGNDDWGDDDNADTSDLDTEEDDGFGFSENLVVEDVQDIVIYIDGAEIAFSQRDLNYSIRNFEGFFRPLRNSLGGNSGILDWPVVGDDLAEVVLSMGDFIIDLYSSGFRVPEASLKADSWLNDSIAGIFSMEVHPIRGIEASFESHSSDLRPRLPYPDSISYVGGLSLKGNQWIGMSHNGEKGLLRISGKENRYAEFRGTRFLFFEEIVTCPSAGLRIIYGEETLDHPGVRMRYRIEDRYLEVFSAKPQSSESIPYTSTQFGIYLDPEHVGWRMDGDSLLMSMGASAHLTPMLIYSDKYFHAKELDRVQGLLPFHPLLGIIKYAEHTDQDSFYAQELLDYWKWDEGHVLSSLRDLHRHRFIDFDERTQRISIRDKGWHYARVSQKDEDHDQFFMASVLGDQRAEVMSHNALLDLAKGELLVGGVKRVHLTKDGIVYVKPKDHQVLLKGAKDFIFDGIVHTNSFNYVGRDFAFDYANFSLTMHQVDSVNILVRDEDPLDPRGGRLSQVRGSIGGTSGVLYLGDPDNKAGIETKPNYPRFSSDRASTVYFDGKEILGGAYDRSIRFEAPPFEVDSLNSSDYTYVGLEGTFHGGNILPSFPEKLRIMEDKSLGFRHNIGVGGYPIYTQSDAIFRGQLRLDLGGIQGDGVLDYLNIHLVSDHWIFYLDRLSAWISEGNIRGGPYKGTSDYPDAVLKDLELRWFPNQGNFLLKTYSNPIRLYEGVAEFSGILNAKKDGTYGSGKLKMGNSWAESHFFSFGERGYGSRETDFQINYLEKNEGIVLRGRDLRLKQELGSSETFLYVEKRGIPSVSFPHLDLMSSLDQVIWKESAEEIYLSHPEDGDIQDACIYLTSPSADSLNFQARTAFYDLGEHVFRAEEISHVEIGDSYIIPPNRELIIRSGGKIDRLLDATIFLGGEDRHHVLKNADIDLVSRNRFTGSADLQHINFAGDTVELVFKDFFFDPDDGMIRAESIANSDDPFPTGGYVFRGKIVVYSRKPDFLLKGYVMPSASHLVNPQWIPHTYSSHEMVSIDLGSSPKTLEGRPAETGLFYDTYFNIYVLLLGIRKAVGNQALYTPEGMLGYDGEKGEYQVFLSSEDDSDALGTSHELDSIPAPTWTLREEINSGTFKGPIYLSEKGDAYGMGYWDSTEKLYQMKTAFLLDLKMKRSMREEFSAGLKSSTIYLSLASAYTETSENFLDLLGHFVSREELSYFEETLFSGTPTPLYELSEKLSKGIFFTELNLVWSPSHKAWYNEDRELYLGNVYQMDMNTRCHGLIEFKPGLEGTDFQCLILLSHKIWYYFRYEGDRWFTVSSQFPYLDAVSGRKSGFYVIDPDEVQDFSRSFQAKYLGGGRPLRLSIPEGIDGNYIFEPLEPPLNSSADGF
ncbi:MAG: hypothetical protein OXB93_04580 [Cytophagales bacterium]|nr:hypothetical protein [Cytophagales bacterium]